MTASPVTLDSRHMTHGDHVVAVVRCDGPVAVEALAAIATTAIERGATRVIVASPDTPAEVLERIASIDPPVATSHPLTDALKRVSGDRIVATVDRSMVHRAGFPLCVAAAALTASIESIDAEVLGAADLLRGVDHLQMVDAGGHVLG